MLKQPQSRYTRTKHGVFTPNAYVRELGNNEARIFSQLLYWLDGRAKKQHENRTWVYKTYAEWGYETGLTESQARHAMTALLGRDLVMKIPNPKYAFDKTPWYSVDADKLDAFENALDVSEAGLAKDLGRADENVGRPDESVEPSDAVRADANARPSDESSTSSDETVRSSRRNRRLIEPNHHVDESNPSVRVDAGVRAVPEPTSTDQRGRTPQEPTPEITPESTAENPTDATPADIPASLKRWTERSTKTSKEAKPTRTTEPPSTAPDVDDGNHGFNMLRERARQRSAAYQAEVSGS